jgi:SAM-dependent methyltransferase
VPSGGYDARLFEAIAEVEGESFWFRARNRLLVSTMRRFFPEARSLLEVGCGTGVVLEALHEAFPALRLVGWEPEPEGLAIARRRLPHGIELVQRDALELDYVGDFDVAGAFDVLEHVQEDDEVLARMRRAVREGGGLILLVPQHPCLWSDADVVARHLRRYRRGELVGKVRRAGFEIVASTSFVSTLLPVLLTSRAARRAFGRAYDPVAELRPGPLNAVFESILGVERRLIELDVSLPLGSSLLVVGRTGPRGATRA